MPCLNNCTGWCSIMLYWTVLIWMHARLLGRYIRESPQQNVIVEALCLKNYMYQYNYSMCLITGIYETGEMLYLCKQTQLQHTHTQIYIYIYIYIAFCHETLGDMTVSSRSIRTVTCRPSILNHFPCHTRSKSNRWYHVYHQSQGWPSSNSGASSNFNMLCPIHPNSLFQSK